MTTANDDKKPRSRAGEYGAGEYERRPGDIDNVSGVVGKIFFLSISRTRPPPLTTAGSDDERERVHYHKLQQDPMTNENASTTTGTMNSTGPIPPKRRPGWHDDTTRRGQKGLETRLRLESLTL